MKGGRRCSMVQWFNGSICSGTRRSGSDGIAMISERGQKKEKMDGSLLISMQGDEANAT